jgi:hypothetical protein
MWVRVGMGVRVVKVVRVGVVSSVRMTMTCSAVLEGKETDEIYHKSTDGDEHQPIVIDSRGLKGTLQQT